MFPVRSIAFEVPEAPGTDSHCHITVNFHDGSTAIVDVGALIALEKPRFLLVGTHGSFVSSGFDPQEATLVAGRPASAAIESAEEYGTLHYRKLSKAHTVPEPSRVVTTPGRWATYYDILNAYLREKESGGRSAPLPPVSLSDVYRDVAILEAALQSAQTGQVVQLPHFH